MAFFLCIFLCLSVVVGHPDAEPYYSYPRGYDIVERGQRGGLTGRPNGGQVEAVDDPRLGGSLRFSTGWRSQEGRKEEESLEERKIGGGGGFSLRGEEREGVGGRSTEGRRQRESDGDRRMLLDVLSRVSLDRKNRTRETNVEKDRTVLQRNLQHHEDCEGDENMCERREERIDRLPNESSKDSDVELDDILDTALDLGFKFPFRLFRRDVPVEDVATRFIQRNGGPSRVVLYLLEDVLPKELGLFTQELVDRFERLQDVLRNLRELLFGDGTTEEPRSTSWASEETGSTSWASEETGSTSWASEETPLTDMPPEEPTGRLLSRRPSAEEEEEEGKGGNLRV